MDITLSRKVIALTIRVVSLVGVCVWGVVLVKCMLLLAFANGTSQTAGGLFCVFVSMAMFGALCAAVGPLNDLANHIQNKRTRNE